MNQLVIVGGGFGGVWAAMSAAAELARCGGENAAITLATNDPALTIRPRLYEGAHPDMRVPLAPLLHEIGVNLVIAEVTGINTATEAMTMADGGRMAFDRLILATGSQLRRPRIPGGDGFALTVDTFDDAKQVDARVATMAGGHGCAVVIGASFTGLEMATELRGRLGDDARILLVDRTDRPGAELGEQMQPLIVDALAQCRIETRLGASVAEIRQDAVVLDTGETLAAGMVILASGMVAHPLTTLVPGERHHDGRLLVDDDLRVIGAGNLFAAGDVALAQAADGHETLMSCQHAMELGRFAGVNGVRDMLHMKTVPYRQEFYATCLDLGRWGAIFTTGWDRRVQKSGAAGKAMKREINQGWIVPPSPTLGRAAIFDQIRLEETTEAGAA